MLDFGEFVGRGPAGELDHWEQRRPLMLPFGLVAGFAAVNQFLWNNFRIALDEQLVPASFVYLSRTYYMDCSKAREHFGYQASISLREGIARVMHSIRSGTHVTLSAKARLKYF
eukprot:m.122619 g.122619  ORF g.122619 m.122619 type:complete len:114 (+) comp52128_c0_seq2:939-1280(+)